VHSKDIHLLISNRLEGDCGVAGKLTNTFPQIIEKKPGAPTLNDG